MTVRFRSRGMFLQRSKAMLACLSHTSKARAKDRERKEGISEKRERTRREMNDCRQDNDFLRFKRQGICSSSDSFLLLSFLPLLLLSFVRSFFSLLLLRYTARQQQPAVIKASAFGLCIHFFATPTLCSVLLSRFLLLLLFSPLSPFILIRIRSVFQCDLLLLLLCAPSLFSLTYSHSPSLTHSHTDTHRQRGSSSNPALFFRLRPIHSCPLHTESTFGTETERREG